MVETSNLNNCVGTHGFKTSTSDMLWQSSSIIDVNYFTPDMSESHHLWLSIVIWRNYIGWAHNYTLHLSLDKLMSQSQPAINLYDIQYITRSISLPIIQCISSTHPSFNLYPMSPSHTERDRQTSFLHTITLQLQTYSLSTHLTQLSIHWFKQVRIQFSFHTKSTHNTTHLTHIHIFTVQLNNSVVHSLTY